MFSVTRSTKISCKVSSSLSTIIENNTKIKSKDQTANAIFRLVDQITQSVDPCIRSSKERKSMEKRKSGLHY